MLGLVKLGHGAQGLVGRVHVELAALVGFLEVLLPLGVHGDVGALVTQGSRVEETGVEGVANAGVEEGHFGVGFFRVGVGVGHVGVECCGGGGCGGYYRGRGSRGGGRGHGDLLDFHLNVSLDVDALGRVVVVVVVAIVGAASAPCSPIDPLLDFDACGVFDAYALIPLVSLSGPQGALPSAEALDFRLGQGQAVECVKKPSVMGEAAEAFAVGCEGVVEAWIPCFDCVEGAVEVGRLDADLADEVLG